MSGLDKKFRFTKIPNVLIDDYLPELANSETVVLLLIARNTWGYHKNSDMISYSQFEENTGLSKNTIRKALESLIEKKMLLKHQSGNSFAYQIKQSILQDKVARNGSIIDGSENDIAKPDTDIVSDSEHSMGEILTPLKSNSKEKEKNTTNSFEAVNDDLQKVIEAWNKRFNNSIQETDAKIVNGVEKALNHFSKEQINKAMDNRLQSQYYRNEKPYLLHKPYSFFGYMETIKNDLGRESESIYTYAEKVALITEQNYQDTHFDIRIDLPDEIGNPKWEYTGPRK
jgi:phage replication O-like protein O